MEYDAEKKKINLNEKYIDKLDKFTIDFVNILTKYSDYVIVSGYVSILLGRTRASEDVDLLIPDMKFSQFDKLFKDLMGEGYECANSSISEDAFEMWNEHAIRFYKGEPLPNIEFKKITNDIQRESFDNKIRVLLKDEELFISPIELQIAYKLSLISQGDFEEISSDKDFEDAKHLYEIFHDKINKDKLIHFIKKLNVLKEFEWLKK